MKILLLCLSIGLALADEAAVREFVAGSKQFTGAVYNVSIEINVHLCFNR
jgi:hypothetical protein